MSFTVLMGFEEDGRYIAEVEEMPGVMAYGKTQDEALLNVLELAVAVLKEKRDAGE